MLLYKIFSFDSAHFLPNVPEGHKCRELHGHTYQLTIFIEGEVSEKEGWIIDFNVLKSAVAPVIELVDHTLLNNVDGLQNPTIELFAKWLWARIKPNLPSLSKLELKETPTSGVIYEGY